MSLNAWVVLFLFFCLYWGTKLLGCVGKIGFSIGSVVGSAIIPLLASFFIQRGSTLGVITIIALESIFIMIVDLKRGTQLNVAFPVSMIYFALGAASSMVVLYLVQHIR